VFMIRSVLLSFQNPYPLNFFILIRILSL
jgi:hypothetical protein